MTVTDIKKEKKVEVANIKITAISLAAPGHFRAGHFWTSGTASWAMLTESQAARVREDSRLKVFKGDVEDAVPETEVLAAMKQENSDSRILAEAERIIERRKKSEGSQRKALERR